MVDSYEWNARDWTLFFVKNLILFAIIMVVIMKYPNTNIPLMQNAMISAVAVIVFIILQLIGDPTFGIRSWICGCEAIPEGFYGNPNPQNRK